MDAPAPKTLAGALLLTLVALMLAIAGTASAATTYTVNRTDDPTPTVGACVSVSSCSVREAEAAADDAPGNTVSIPAGHYTLTLGQISIPVDMTIAGAGARSTIVDGGGNSRVFNINNFVNVTIKDLSVTGGDTGGDGGGIFTEGNLTLTSVAVVNNRAGFGGGGVATIGPFPEDPTNDIITLTIDRSNISTNKVTAGGGNGQGGGIQSFGNLSVTNSTVSGNSVDDTGINQGGGIVSSSGDFQDTSGLITLLNTTITGNTVTGATPAGGGGGVRGDDALVKGVPFSSEFRATNTIVANNLVDGVKADCSLVNTTTTANNISSDSSCGFGDSNSRQNADPGVGPLQNNGGPTDTEAIGFTSLAFNLGTNTGCPAIDQRGVARPQQSTCDIGAFEFAPPTAVTGPANSIKTTSANITGDATNPHVDGGTAFFEWGTSTAYGSTTPVVDVAAFASGAPESSVLTGLKSGTTYHYRLVVINHDSPSFGQDMTFKTTSAAKRAKPRVSVAGIPRSCVSSAFTVRIKVRVAKGTRLRSVRVRLDGKLIKKTSKKSFKIRVRASKLRTGRHKLSIRATDRGRRSRVLTRSFSRCAVRASPRFTG
jgi:hypothetical protein